MDFTGSGDPQRTVELLWGVPAPPRRGPKPKLTVDDIAATAIGIADREGLAAVTLRRVAGDLGVATMSLYGYVPGKAELLDLLADRAWRDYPMPGHAGCGWRARLESIARANWATYQAHPWLLRIATSRPLLGPHHTAKYDYELSAVDGLGLTDIDMGLIIRLVNDYVRGGAHTAIDAAAAENETGFTEHHWWQRVAPALARVLDPARYPIAVRVGAAAGAEYAAAHDPARAFDFGLQRLLDGLHLYIDHAAPGTGDF